MERWATQACGLCIYLNWPPAPPSEWWNRPELFDRRSFLVCEELLNLHDGEFAFISIGRANRLRSDFCVSIVTHNCHRQTRSDHVWAIRLHSRITIVSNTPTQHLCKSWWRRDCGPDSVSGCSLFNSLVFKSWLFFIRFWMAGRETQARLRPYSK